MFETTDEFEDEDIAADFGLSEVDAKRNVLRGKPYRIGEVPETLRKYIESTDKLEHN